MAMSWQKMQLDAGATDIQCDIEYLDKAYIHVYLDGVETQDYYWASSTLIKLNTALSKTTTVLLLRITEKEYPFIEFASGAPFIESNVDIQNTQLLHLAQENTEHPVFQGDVDMSGFRVINMKDPEEPQDAATKHWVDEQYSVPTSEAKQAAVEAKAAYEQTREIADKFGDVDAAVIGAEAARDAADVSAQNAAAEADRAEVAASAAESIVDIEGTYPDVATGLANTAAGKYFRVPMGTGSSLAFKYYLNQSGTAVEVAYLASQVAVVDAQNRSRVGATGAWVNNTLYPFSTFASNNENDLRLHADAPGSTTYKEAYAPLTQTVASGAIVTVKYKYSGSGGVPTIGLKTSQNGTFVSNQPRLTKAQDYVTVQLTATAATATLLAVSLNTSLASDINLSLIVSTNNKNAITTAVLDSIDGINSLSSQLTLGAVNKWVNNPGYPFSTFSQVNANRINFGNGAGVYSEMYADTYVAEGSSIKLNYALNLNSGRLWARLANGGTFVSDEVQLSPGGNRQSVTLTASSGEAKQVKLYSKAEVSTGSVFVEVLNGVSNALTEQVDSLYKAIASANAILAILSQSSTFTTTEISSPYTYKIADSGASYKQLISTVDAISGVSTVKMMYKVEATNAVLKLQSRNGGNWGANEVAITADGAYHEVDLPIASGTVFSGWGVYSAARTGGYSADITMIPVSADGVFFTPATAVLYGLMQTSADLDGRVSSLEQGVASDQNTDVIFPSNFYAVDGRPLRFYGANMVSGSRPWRNNTEVVLSSHGYSGKPILLKGANPDATLMPSEVGGAELVVNVRADASTEIYRKKASFNLLPAAQSGAVKVATIMDSLGERCVPWLYFAMNSTGATYTGVGSRRTRGMTDGGEYVLPNTPSDGIPFDGRGGWTTFDYLGKTQKTNFSQPFLREANATDKATYPQYCFDVNYSGQSYSENSGLSGYHIFDVAAWMTASGVSSGDKLVVVIQLGYNDLYYGYTPLQTALAQEFMITKFKELIPNARFVVSHQAFGWSGTSAPGSWEGFTPWITQKIKQFDNRLSDKILLAPAWAQLSYKYGMGETVVSTSDTGVQRVSLTDDVHPGELGGAQWGDALLAPVLAAWQL